MIKKFFKNLCTTLYKNSVIIMVVATLCVVLSVGYTTMYAKVTYTAKAEVLLHSHALSDTPLNAMVQPEISPVDTALEVFNSKGMFTFLTETELSEKKYSLEELDEMIEVTRKDKNSLVLIVTVTCDDDDEAVELAKVFSSSMQRYIIGFTSEFFADVLSVDEDAVMNKPSIALTVIAALIVGALLGSVTVVILDKFNQRLRGVSDYRARYSATLLGTVPDFSVKKEDK